MGKSATDVRPAEVLEEVEDGALQALEALALHRPGHHDAALHHGLGYDKQRIGTRTATPAGPAL